MNLLKKFVRNDNANLAEEEEYEDIYAIPEDIKMEMSDVSTANAVSAMDSPERKDPEIHPASPDKVSLKLLQPKSHTEAAVIADKLKDGCIVLLDISNLTKEQAHRLVDFLAGVAYVLGGEMIKTNKNTIVVSPAGVDISGFAQQQEAAAPAPAPAEEYEEYEEVPAQEN
ncbi:MAG: cell division protein SepF [Clostridia bacterium]|nr:cell division protein SepF [Clostridia bacterium]